MQSILVKRLDRSIAVKNQTMDQTIIKDKLLKSETKLSFFYDDLPALSGAIEDDFVCNIFKSYTQKAQKVGNCWWVSPKSQILAVMAMSKLQSTPIEGMKEEEAKRHADNALAEAKQVYKEFSKFSKIHLFKEYLAEKMQEKDSRGDAIISPDFELLRQIYQKLINKYPEEKQTLLDSIKPFKNDFNIQIISNKCPDNKLNNSRHYIHSDEDSGFLHSDVDD
jgi:hypothetical protein